MSDPPAPETSRPTVAVPRSLAVAAAWSWRFLVVAGALYVTVRIVVRLQLVLLPVFVALLLASALVPVRRRLSATGMPRPLAMLATVAVFFGVIAGISALIVPPLVNELSDLDATIDEAVDEVEEWLVDGPLGLDAERVDSARRELTEGTEELLTADGVVVDGARLVGELFAALLLSLVVTFFVVKDGEDMQRVALRWLPSRHHDRIRAAASAAWASLGGYLRASAMLGIIEGVVIGITLAVVGADLAVPVASLTFVAAFFPFVGAIVAGVVAAMVAFVTAGSSAAIVVVVVAVVVQQLDNDLLAPLIFGRALHLHPLVVVLALATGATLGGLAGAFLAVPLTATGLRVARVLLEPPE